MMQMLSFSKVAFSLLSMSKIAGVGMHVIVYTGTVKLNKEASYR